MIDAVFFAAIQSGDIPTEYLRSLAEAESSLNPKAKSATGARGLFQITGDVLRRFNVEHGTAHTPDNLYDPHVNAEVAVDYLRHITRSLAKYRAGEEDWGSERWVAILTLAWNAGYSDASGVGYVVGHLERVGVKPKRITVDSIHEASKALKSASENLREPGRVRWAKKVAGDYAGERGGSLLGALVALLPFALFLIFASRAIAERKVT